MDENSRTALRLDFGIPAAGFLLKQLAAPIDRAGSKMEDTDPRGMRDGIGAADGVELLQQLRDVILGRMRRNPEPTANELVRRALSEERKHLQFPGGERDARFRLDRRRKRDDNKRVRVIVLAD